MDLKKGDLVKIIESFASFDGKLGTVKHVHIGKWNTDITVEFTVTRAEAEARQSRTIYARDIERVIITEIYQPFQLLRIPNTKLGRLLYV